MRLLPWRWLRFYLLVGGLQFVVGLSNASAAPVVPGTGQKIPQVGDDFEDPKWSFVHNHPKSSEEQDDQKRQPTGRSTNGRWFEGIKRGQPDMMKYVPTPEGGLPGSTGSLLMRTLQSGIPGSLSHQMQQDDLIVNCQQRLPAAIPVSQSPSCVVRVYVPPFEEWEKRTGPTFGFRLSVETHKWKVPEEKKGRFWSKPEYAPEIYWPGMFIQFRSVADGRQKANSAYFAIRGNQLGHEVKGPEITTAGWWTLGMSCTPDGMIHYYVSPGIDNLTEKDFVTSQFPYGYHTEKMRTFFFNVCNLDDGRTWSTPWIIDDPSLYVASTGIIAAAPQPARK